ncbi:MAG: tetratricopeptide repeat protein [Candidatus Lernaella stagnicola]|nr:tetratricopeptide repeat protein [Candidatus Lernaella stagnicola]
MNPEVKTMLEDARDAYDRGDFAVAEKLFTQLVRHQPQWSELYGKLGAIYHRAGRFTDAVKLYAYALQLNPRYIEARLNLSVLLNDMGHYDHAAKLVGKMSKIIPYPGRLGMGTLANKHVATGDAYFALELFNHARIEYEHAAKLRPGWPDLKIKLGIAFRRLGRTADAVREINAALEIHDDNPRWHSELALSYFQSGDVQHAVATWQAVLQRWPDHEPSARYLTMARGKGAETSAA